jgi:hypothetical protein
MVLLLTSLPDRENIEVAFSTLWLSTWYPVRKKLSAKVNQ